LHRAALRESELHAELLPYWRVSVVDVTGSTQTDLAESVHSNSANDGEVLIANFQSAGRGRLDREFVAAPSSAILFSLYKKVKRPRAEWNFLALLTALSIAEALTSIDANQEIKVKWPNDILLNEKKIAGLLSQATDNGVIIGVGLNVSMREDELPVDTATSLILEGFSEVDRNVIIKKILQVFEKHFMLWEIQGSAPFISAYEKICSSLQQKIQIILPNEDSKEAEATGISPLGELLLRDGSLVNSADILHLR